MSSSAAAPQARPISFPPRASPTANLRAVVVATHREWIQHVKQLNRHTRAFSVWEGNSNKLFNTSEAVHEAPDCGLVAPGKQIPSLIVKSFPFEENAQHFEETKALFWNSQGNVQCVVHLIWREFDNGRGGTSLACQVAAFAYDRMQRVAQVINSNFPPLQTSSPAQHYPELRLVARQLYAGSVPAILSAYQVFIFPTQPLWVIALDLYAHGTITRPQLLHTRSDSFETSPERVPGSIAQLKMDSPTRRSIRSASPTMNKLGSPFPHYDIPPPPVPPAGMQKVITMQRVVKSTQPPRSPISRSGSMDSTYSASPIEATHSRPATPTSTRIPLGTRPLTPPFTVPTSPPSASASTQTIHQTTHSCGLDHSRALKDCLLCDEKVTPIAGFTSDRHPFEWLGLNVHMAIASEYNSQETQELQEILMQQLMVFSEQLKGTPAFLKWQARYQKVPAGESSPELKEEPKAEVRKTEEAFQDQPYSPRSIMRALSGAKRPDALEPEATNQPSPDIQDQLSPAFRSGGRSVTHPHTNLNISSGSEFDSGGRTPSRSPNRSPLPSPRIRFRMEGRGDDRVIKSFAGFVREDTDKEEEARRVRGTVTKVVKARKAAWGGTTITFSSDDSDEGERQEDEGDDYFGDSVEQKEKVGALMTKEENEAPRPKDMAKRESMFVGKEEGDEEDSVREQRIADIIKKRLASTAPQTVTEEEEPEDEPKSIVRPESREVEIKAPVPTVESEESVVSEDASTVAGSPEQQDKTAASPPAPEEESAESRAEKIKMLLMKHGRTDSEDSIPAAAENVEIERRLPRFELSDNESESDDGSDAETTRDYRAASPEPTNRGSFISDTAPEVPAKEIEVPVEKPVATVEKDVAIEKEIVPIVPVEQPEPPAIVEKVVEIPSLSVTTRDSVVRPLSPKISIHTASPTQSELEAKDVTHEPVPVQEPFRDEQQVPDSEEIKEIQTVHSEELKQAEEKPTPLPLVLDEIRPVPSSPTDSEVSDFDEIREVNMGHVVAETPTLESQPINIRASMDLNQHIQPADYLAMEDMDNNFMPEELHHTVQRTLTFSDFQKQAEVDESEYDSDVETPEVEKKEGLEIGTAVVPVVEQAKETDAVAIPTPEAVVEQAKEAETVAIPAPQPVAEQIKEVTILEEESVVEQVKEIAIPAPEPVVEHVNEIETVVIPAPEPVVEQVKEIAIPAQESVVEHVNEIETVVIPAPEPVVEQVKEITIPAPEPVVEQIAISEAEPVIEQVKETTTIAIPEPPAPMVESKAAVIEDEEREVEPETPQQEYSARDIMKALSGLAVRKDQEEEKKREIVEEVEETVPTTANRDSFYSEYSEQERQPTNRDSVSSVYSIQRQRAANRDSIYSDYSIQGEQGQWQAANSISFGYSVQENEPKRDLLNSEYSVEERKLGNRFSIDSDYSVVDKEPEMDHVEELKEAVAEALEVDVPVPSPIPAPVEAKDEALVVESPRSVSPAPEVEAPVVEAPKVEVPAVEIRAVEETKIEASVIEEARIEAHAIEESKVEVPVTEEAKIEAPAVEVRAVEIPAVIIPAVEEAKVEAPVLEEPKVEVPTAEERTIEVPVAEEAKVEVPNVEKAKIEAPAVDEPTVEVPVAEEVMVQVPIVEEVKIEAPVVEEPKLEAPVVEEAKIEVPVVEVREIETPKVEEPQAQEQAVEEPKTRAEPIDIPPVEVRELDVPDVQTPKVEISEVAPVTTPTVDSPAIVLSPSLPTRGRSPSIASSTTRVRSPTTTSSTYSGYEPANPRWNIRNEGTLVAPYIANKEAPLPVVHRPSLVEQSTESTKFITEDVETVADRRAAFEPGYQPKIVAKAEESEAKDRSVPEHEIDVEPQLSVKELIAKREGKAVEQPAKVEAEVGKPAEMVRQLPAVETEEVGPKIELLSHRRNESESTVDSEASAAEPLSALDDTYAEIDEMLSEAAELTETAAVAEKTAVVVEKPVVIEEAPSQVADTEVEDRKDQEEEMEEAVDKAAVRLSWSSTSSLSHSLPRDSVQQLPRDSVQHQSGFIEYANIPTEYQHAPQPIHHAPVPMVAYRTMPVETFDNFEGHRIEELSDGDTESEYEIGEVRKLRLKGSKAILREEDKHLAVHDGHYSADEGETSYDEALSHQDEDERTPRAMSMTRSVSEFSTKEEVLQVIEDSARAETPKPQQIVEDATPITAAEIKAPEETASDTVDNSATSTARESRSSFLGSLRRSTVESLGSVWGLWDTGSQTGSARGPADNKIQTVGQTIAQLTDKKDDETFDNTRAVEWPSDAEAEDLEILQNTRGVEWDHIEKKKKVPVELRKVEVEEKPVLAVEPAEIKEKATAAVEYKPNEDEVKPVVESKQEEQKEPEAPLVVVPVQVEETKEAPHIIEPVQAHEVLLPAPTQSEFRAESERTVVPQVVEQKAQDDQLDRELLHHETRDIHGMVSTWQEGVDRELAEEARLAAEEEARLFAENARRIAEASATRSETSSELHAPISRTPTRPLSPRLVTTEEEQYARVMDDEGDYDPNMEYPPSSDTKKKFPLLPFVLKPNSSPRIHTFEPFGPNGERRLTRRTTSKHGSQASPTAFEEGYSQSERGGVRARDSVASWAQVPKSDGGKIDSGLSTPELIEKPMEHPAPIKETKIEEQKDRELPSSPTEADKRASVVDTVLSYYDIDGEVQEDFSHDDDPGLDTIQEAVPPVVATPVPTPASPPQTQAEILAQIQALMAQLHQTTGKSPAPKLNMQMDCEYDEMIEEELEIEISVKVRYRGREIKKHRNVCGKVREGDVVGNCGFPSGE